MLIISHPIIILASLYINKPLQVAACPARAEHVAGLQDLGLNEVKRYY
jgi:hypothetical protein